MLARYCGLPIARIADIGLREVDYTGCAAKTQGRFDIALYQFVQIIAPARGQDKATFCRNALGFHHITKRPQALGSRERDAPIQERTGCLLCTRPGGACVDMHRSSMAETMIWRHARLLKAERPA